MEQIIIDPKVDAIAESIAKISEAMKLLYNSGLNEKALILLISDASGVGKRDVKYVLENLFHLGNTYLAPKKKVSQ